MSRSGTWLAVAFPRLASTGVVTPLYWGTRSLTTGSSSEETATVDGVASIADTYFDGVMDGAGTSVKRSVMGGGSTLFSSRSRADFGSLRITLSGSSLAVSDYEWSGARILLYYADGFPSLFSDYSLRRSLRFVGEPEVVGGSDDYATFKVGTWDYSLGRPVQRDRYKGTGSGIRLGENTDFPDSTGVASTVGTTAHHPGHLYDADFTIAAKVRLEPPVGGTVGSVTLLDTGAGASTLRIKFDHINDDAEISWPDSGGTNTVSVAGGFPTWVRSEEEVRTVIVSRDTATRTVKVYWDGVLAGSQTWIAADDPVIPLANVADSVSIGGGGFYSIFGLSMYREVLDPDGVDDLGADAAVHYGFNEGSGLEVFERNDRVVAETGYLITGTAQYVQFADNSVWDFGDHAEARVRVTFSVPEIPASTAAYILYRGSVVRIYVSQTDGKLYAGFYDGTGAAWMTSLVSLNAITPGEVYTVDLVMSENSQVARLYLDGELQEKRTYTGVTFNSVVAATYAGGAGTADGDGAWIFDVGVWHKNSSAREISDEWSTKLTGGEYGIKAYFPFDEGSGTTVYDSVTFDPDTGTSTYSGTLSGGEWATSKLDLTMGSGSHNHWTDSYEGGPTLAGRWKPEGLGRVIGKSPTPVNMASGVYQLHRSQILQVIRATDGGSVLYNAGDCDDLFSTFTENGRFRLPGTVSISTANDQLVGVGTQFTAWLLPGHTYNVNGDQVVIESVEDDWNATLLNNGPATSSGVNIYRSQPRAGWFRTDLSRGLIQFGGPPQFAYEVEYLGGVDEVHGFSSEPTGIAQVAIEGAIGERWRWLDYATGNKSGLPAYEFDFGNNFENASTSFSAGGWVKPDESTNGFVFLGYEEPMWMGRRLGWELRYKVGNDTSPEEQYRVKATFLDASDVRFTATSIEPLSDREAHLVAMAVDRVNDELRLYVDGVLQETVDISTAGNIKSGSSNMTLGRNYSDGTGGADMPMLIGPHFVSSDPDFAASAYSVMRFRKPYSSEVDAYWNMEEQIGTSVADEFGTYDGTMATNNKGVPKRDGGAIAPLDVTALDSVTALYPCQVWAGTEPSPASEWVDRLARSWRGWWGVSKEGKLSVGVFDQNAASSRTINAVDVDDRNQQLRARMAVQPASSIRVGYALREAVIAQGQGYQFGDPEELARVTGVMDTPFEYVEKETGTSYPDAVPLEYLTAHSTKAGALWVWTWLASLFGSVSWLFSFAVSWLSTQDDENGDVLTIEEVPIITDGTPDGDPGIGVLVEINDRPEDGVSDLTVWTSGIKG